MMQREQVWIALEKMQVCFLNPEGVSFVARELDGNVEVMKRRMVKWWTKRISRFIFEYFFVFNLCSSRDICWNWCVCSFFTRMVLKYARWAWGYIQWRENNCPIWSLLSRPPLHPFLDAKWKQILSVFYSSRSFQGQASWMSSQWPTVPVYSQ